MFQFFLVTPACVLEVADQRLVEIARHANGTRRFSSGIADQDGGMGEIEITDTQAQHLKQAHPAVVHQHRGKSVVFVHDLKHRGKLFAGKRTCAQAIGGESRLVRMGAGGLGKAKAL